MSSVSPTAGISVVVDGAASVKYSVVDYAVGELRVMPCYFSRSSSHAIVVVVIAATTPMLSSECLFGAEATGIVDIGNASYLSYDAENSLGRLISSRVMVSFVRGRQY